MNTKNEHQKLHIAILSNTLNKHDLIIGLDMDWLEQAVQWVDRLMRQFNQLTVIVWCWKTQTCSEMLENCGVGNLKITCNGFQADRSQIY